MGTQREPRPTVGVCVVGGCYPGATGSSITKGLWVCFGRGWKWEASEGVDQEPDRHRVMRDMEKLQGLDVPSLLKM